MKFFLFSFNSVFLKFSIFTLLITSIFLISACDQDSADGHDHDEEIHADVDGFLLQTSDNQEIYREFKGSTSGNILIKNGQSLELSVSFLDDDGNKIPDPFDFQDKAIHMSEYGKAIISFELKQNVYPFTILISGLDVGQTTTKLQLLHEGHPDYTSTNKIPVTVE